MSRSNLAWQTNMRGYVDACELGFCQIGQEAYLLPRGHGKAWLSTRGASCREMGSYAG